MPVLLSVHATEKSTYIVTITFTEENGAVVIPDTIKWTLTDLYNTTINSLEDVIIAVPAASNDVLLKGDDLQILGSGDDGARVFTVEATYTSLTFGANLPLNGSARFSVDDLIAVNG